VRQEPTRNDPALVVDPAPARGLKQIEGKDLGGPTDNSCGPRRGPVAGSALSLQDIIVNRTSELECPAHSAGFRFVNYCHR